MRAVAAVQLFTDGEADACSLPLTVAEIAEHAKRLTYRPGWRFQIYTGRYEGAHIAIQADLPDAENVGQTVRVRIDSNLPPFDDVRQFEQWLLWRLGIIEMHECREWFRRDGSIVADPHAPDAQHDL